ncbi:MAG: transglutaminase domain-containing protein [Nitrospinae bacterium]|nr:transglutaminase domain-containing protein [Nitrospinota bacterium]
MSKQKYIVAWVSLLLGCLLLIINSIGFIMGPVVNTNLKGRKPVSNYDYRTLILADANHQFSELLKKNISPEDKARGLFELISRSFIHTPSEYRIKAGDNWIMWLGGTLFDRRYFKSQDPDFLWKKGGGFCSQAAIIFVAKGKELGLKTRLIGLKGHVVAEVYLPDKGWRMVDPDMGIFWDHDLDSFGVNPSEEQVKSELLARGHSEKISRHFSRIYVSQENNSRNEYPTAPNRFFLEKVCNWLKWLIPLGLICFSWQTGRVSYRLKYP